jgi:trk system potassium uptake protein TrkA
MRIIIAGAGDVGFHLARLLVQENHDITLIEKNAEKLKYAAEHLDIATLKGNSISYSILEEANVAKSDLVIAVTSSEESNITTAIIAKNLGAKKTIARISNVEFLLKKEKFDLEKLGIDEIISPETLAAREIKRLLKEVAVTDSFEFDRGLLSLAGMWNREAPVPTRPLQRRPATTPTRISSLSPSCGTTRRSFHGAMSLSGWATTCISSPSPKAWSAFWSYRPASASASRM